VGRRIDVETVSEACVREARWARARRTCRIAPAGGSYSAGTGAPRSSDVKATAAWRARSVPEASAMSFNAAGPKPKRLNRVDSDRQWRAGGLDRMRGRMHREEGYVRLRDLLPWRPDSL
jgi:hypothetical protein